MKIAFLSFYSGNVNRGVETYAHELANNLVDLGNEVTVYQNGQKSNGAKYVTRKMNTPFNWSRKFGPDTLLSKCFLDYRSIKILQFSMDVVSDLIRQDIDIIVPLNGGWQALLIRFLSFLKGAKMVVAGQSGPGRDDKFNLFMFPDAFVGFTDHQCKWAKNVNTNVRVEKIPNGIDLSKFKADGQKIETKLKHPLVLVVAALVPIKRIDLTIQAVAKLKNANLLIVGEGELKEELDMLGQKLMPGRFEIRQYKYQDMPKVYRAADLFAFSTQAWESFGIVMLEAMANNLPVVASNDPIRKEIIGDAGLVVDVEDTDEYAKALKEALNNKWGNKPQMRAKEFAWEIIAEKYNTLFRSLTNAN